MCKTSGIPTAAGLVVDKLTAVPLIDGIPAPTLSDSLALCCPSASRRSCALSTLQPPQVQLTPCLQGQAIAVLGPEQIPASKQGQLLVLSISAACALLPRCLS